MMADNPEKQPVDPDAPTAQGVKQALAELPTWEEWLQQQGFIKGEKHRSAISAVEWNRDWLKHGRGWRLRVAPSLQTINIIVYNGILSRIPHQVAMVSVAERSVVNIVAKLVTELDRSVSDATKKRRIRVYTSTIPYEQREDDVSKINGPVLPPRHVSVLTQEAGSIRRPIPDDPGDLNPEQMGQMFDRLQSHCFQKGQRVRVRTQRQTRLNGEVGTVVDAGPHSAYVAIDSFVQAGDPDPFRFEEQELEPIFESVENMDAPEPYMAALDYITLLRQVGYSQIKNKRSETYRKVVQDEKGFLVIRVSLAPHEATKANVHVDYSKSGDSNQVYAAVVDAIDVADFVRKLEALYTASSSAVDYVDKLETLGYPNGSVSTHREHLINLFGESVVESDDVDDPQPYFQELQRHADFINVFREYGVKMRRRMKKPERPYYVMFWIPSAVTDVSYDIRLTPTGDYWSVTASGQKEFQHEIHGDFQEDFEIDREWTIPSKATTIELVGEVGNILYALTEYHGPDEPTVNEPDVDDIDESVENIGVDDPEGYVKRLAKVQCCPRCQSRDTVRTLGGVSGGTEYWKCNACGDKFLWSNDRAAGFKLEGIDDPEQMDVNTYVNKTLDARTVLTDLGYVDTSNRASTGASGYNQWTKQLNSELRMAVHVDEETGKWNYTVYARNPARAGSLVLKYAPHVVEPISTMWVYLPELEKEVMAVPAPWQERPAEGLDEPVADPDDPEAFLKRARTPQMGEIVDVTCPHCGDKRQLAKNWPDNMPNWGSECAKCGGFITLPTVVLGEGVDDPAEVLLRHKPKAYALYGQYANYDTPISFGTYKTLPEAVRRARERDLYAEYDIVWADEVEFASLDKWDTGETMACDYTGIKYYITRNYEPMRIEQPGDPNGYVRPPKLNESDDAEALRYAQTTLDPVEFLKAEGWKFHSDQHYTYYAKTFKMPRPYQLGGMMFTGVEVRVGYGRNLFNQAAVGIYFVDDEGRGFGIQGCDLSRQAVYPWNEADYDTPPESFFDNGMSIRRFARGIEKVIQNAAWPEKREASLVASNAVKAEVDRFVKELNQQAQVPIYNEPPVQEAVDDPLDLLSRMPTHTFVTFKRSLAEDREIAEGNFPGVPLDQALTRQLMLELEDSGQFDMSTVKVASPAQIVREDDYTVRVLFQGYMSDVELRKRLQKACEAHGMAGEFDIEQFRPDVAEALDPDDPTDILQSQPGFEFRHTQHMGDMVFVKGPGEDTSDWPRDIGHIILGPSPNPNVNPEQRWYVVDVRGVPQEKLSEIGFGIHRAPNLRTFDGPEEAALAIWLTRSRMPEKEGVLGKTRKLPEPHQIVREAIGGEPEDTRAEIDRLLPTKTYTLQGNSMINAAGVLRMAQNEWQMGRKKQKAWALGLVKAWPGLPEEAYLAILNGKVEVEAQGDHAVVTIKQY